MPGIGSCIFIQLSCINRFSLQTSTSTVFKKTEILILCICRQGSLCNSRLGGARSEVHVGDCEGGDDERMARGR